MMSKVKQSRLSLAWKLTFTGGLFPLIVGSVSYALMTISLLAPTNEWLNIFGPTGYSFAQIQSFTPGLAADWASRSIVAYTNLIVTGVTVCIISWVGLRRGYRWAWLLLLFGFVWVGGNDVVAVLIAGRLPVPAIPLTLGLAGLLLSAREVLSRRIG